MAFSLYPAFFTIEYHSAYAPHLMTVPVVDWNPGLVNGDFVTHNAGSVAALGYISLFVDTIKPFFPATVVFDNFVIYTMDSPTAPAIPRTGAALAVVGTNIAAGNTKALQATLTMKTSLGNLFKQVLLDMGNNNSFERVTAASLGGAGAAWVAFLQDLDGAICGRDRGAPQFFLQISYTLNERLRREYHMD